MFRRNDDHKGLDKRSAVLVIFLNNYSVRNQTLRIISSSKSAWGELHILKSTLVDKIS